MKFAENLKKSNKAIKEDRANRIAELVSIKQRNLVSNLEEKVINLKSKLADLEDLNPDTTMSLNPVKGNFNADAWVNDIQKVKLDLAIAEEEYAIARETQEEYFTEKKK